MGKTTMIRFGSLVRRLVRQRRLGFKLGAALALSTWTLGAPSSALAQDAFTSYEVDLTDRTGDTFKVTLTFSGLSASDDIFQFAATACLGMAGDDLFHQRCAGAWHPDDEYRNL